MMLRSIAQVPSAFDRAAYRYDLLTGLNPGYRRDLRRSAERMPLAPRARILDLCCGTGLSTRALRAAHPGAQIVGLDGSEGMIREARRKPDLADVEWIVADAMKLEESGVRGPFEGVFMAYGIRNMPDPDACLAQIRRVLAPNGIACFHEYTLAKRVATRFVWSAVACGIIIPTGLAFTGSAELYRYLWQSVKTFDDPQGFNARLQRAGFSDVRVAGVGGWQRGIVHSFVARVG